MVRRTCDSSVTVGRVGARGHYALALLATPTLNEQTKTTMRHEPDNKTNHTQRKQASNASALAGGAGVVPPQ